MAISMPQTVSTAPIHRMSSVRLADTLGIGGSVSAIAREVRFRVKFYKIAKIDLLQHSFTTDFFIEASWVDDLLPRETKTLCSADRWEHQFPYRQVDDPSLRWTPRLQFTNKVKLWDREDWYSTYATDASGQLLPKSDGVVVCYKMRARGTFHTQFHIRDFPFDAQDLAIVFNSCFHIDRAAAIGLTGTTPRPRERPRSLSDCRADSRSDADLMTPSSDTTGPNHRKYNVRLVKNTNPKYASVVPTENNFFLGEEYYLDNAIHAYEKHSEPEMSSSGLEYPLLVVACRIQRKPHFFFMNAVLPMFLFVLLGFPTLLLDPSELSDRLGLILTLLLTATAYKTYIVSELPKLSYSTWLDRYMIVCILGLTVLGLESTLMFWLASMDQRKQGRAASCDWTMFQRWYRRLAKFEDSAGLVCALGWCFVHLVFMRRVWWKAHTLTKLEREQAGVK